VDYAALIDRVTATVDQEADSIPPIYNAHPNITLFSGTGTFVGPRSIKVNDQVITGKRIFIAAGVRPRIPAIPGLEDTPYLTHKEALRLKQKPRSMTIIGGGFIGVELGHFFAAAGTRVTLLSRSDLLKEYDPDIRSEFTNEFSNHITVYEGIQFERISHNGEAFHIKVTINGQPKSIHSEHLLIATGMIPNSDILNASAGGIETDPDGSILVNTHLETSAEGVWAFGDIIGQPYFRHKANFEGDYLYRNLYEAPNNTPIHYPPIPWAVFSYPQIAGFGPSETELNRNNIPHVVGKAAYKDSAMGMAYRSQYGFVKLIFDRQTRRLISGFATGPNAATMIHMPLAFAQMNATLDDMLSTIYIHPALPEIVRNAARKANTAFIK
jgi:dihydrolipoamide dehydrogenase